jgi:HEAT repeat protein
VTLRPRISVGMILFLIAVVAVQLAALRPSYERSRQQVLDRRGFTTLGTFGGITAAGVGRVNWHTGVVVVRDAWAIKFGQPYATDSADLAALNSNLEALRAASGPNSAEGDLHAALDLIAHAPPRDARYRIGEQRRKLKLALHDDGLSSPALVAYALERVARPLEDPVADLAALLARPDWRVRVAACRALGRLAVDGRPGAVAALASAFGDADPLVREVAVEGLDDLGAGTPAAALTVGALVKALGDRHAPVRIKAIVALGRLGPAAGAAAPHLVRAHADGADDFERYLAAVALSKVGASPEAAPGVLDSLRGERAIWAAAARCQIARAVARSGPGAAPVLTAALPDLVDDLRIENRPHRASTLEALRTVGHPARPALPAVFEILREGAPIERLSAVCTLFDIGAPAGDAIALLIAALGDGDADVRRAAALNLGRYGTVAEVAIADLLRVAQGDPEDHVRTAASIAVRAVREESASPAPRGRGRLDPGWPAGGRTQGRSQGADQARRRCGLPKTAWIGPWPWPKLTTTGRHRRGGAADAEEASPCRCPARASIARTISSAATPSATPRPTPTTTGKTIRFHALVFIAAPRSPSPGCSPSIRHTSTPMQAACRGPGAALSAGFPAICPSRPRRSGGFRPTHRGGSAQIPRPRASPRFRGAITLPTQPRPSGTTSPRPAASRGGR